MIENKTVLFILFNYENQKRFQNNFDRNVALSQWKIKHNNYKINKNMKKKKKKKKKAFRFSKMFIVLINNIYLLKNTKTTINNIFNLKLFKKSNLKFMKSINY